MIITPLFLGDLNDQLRKTIIEEIRKCGKKEIIEALENDEDIEIGEIESTENFKKF